MSRKTLAWLVVADVVSLWVVMWLVMRHLVPERPAVLAVLPILLISNFLILRRSATSERAPRYRRIPILAWFGLGLYTVAALVAVSVFMAKPSSDHVLGALGATGVAAYLWWMMLRAKRATEPRERAESHE